MNELLREMQREKQHMRIVIDEYGGVAGLVTIEDLLEEIVGTISDEHENDTGTVLHDADGSWIVPGNLEIARLEETCWRERRRFQKIRGDYGGGTGKRGGGADSAGGRGE